MIGISSYIRITNSKVIRDGVAIFVHEDRTTFFDALYDFIGAKYPKFFKMDELSKAGYLGAELLGALFDKPASTAIVLSNSSSSLDTDARYWQTVKEQASPSLFVYTLPNIVAGEISIRHGLKGESIFFVSPAFDPQWLASYVSLLMAGNTNACLAGWLEVTPAQIDVLLYLVDKSEVSHSSYLPHSSPKISEIYSLWNS